jgi:hypothetical protein
VALLKEAEKEAAKVARTAEKVLKDTERKAAKIAKAVEIFLKDAEKNTTKAAKAAERAVKAAQVIENRATAAATTTRGHKVAAHGAQCGCGKKTMLVACLFSLPDVQELLESFNTSSNLTISPINLSSPL